MDGESGPAEHHAEKPVQQQVSGGRSDGDMDERGDKKSGGQDSHRHDLLIVDFLQPDGGARYRQTGSGQENRTGKNPF